MPRGKEILRVEKLTLETSDRRGRRGVIAREVSLTLHQREIVGLIGESGSGKTLTAMALLGLLPRGVRVTSGSAWLQDAELFSLPPRDMRALRGDRIALIPQDALHALNPVLRIGPQVGEPLVIHRGSGWQQALARAVELLGLVRLPEAARRATEYPHEFSGGMQQRTMIAMGLALRPPLVIADEPTTALDVTIQAQILELLDRMRNETGTAFLFITHDLGVVAQTCDWVYVMYGGEVVESGSTRDIFSTPSHPYTRALITAMPTVAHRADSLTAIPGQIPSPFEATPGCRFAARCEHRVEKCSTVPPTREVSRGHWSRCWFAEAGSG